ncbi:DUF7344 domain-containing protein [Halopelagius longus]|uniref:ArsR family transcriptional regulator n=1 Tax=Halopelagius longus TaxID=1236180 RepID=A0A1H0ZAT4_9EURY|nr:hypothetical protein [Halopelagius longus]RDI72914.1 ArsR family transcriptional regulator [Halopelagius longus]SDQ24530.1 hypothetical protein SAMN05216278_1115 [Halopelagius longus]
MGFRDGGGDGGGSGGKEAALTLDAVLETLGHRHRRTLLRLFRDRSTRAVDSDEAVEYLLERERRRPGETPSRDHLQITLLHAHLPKLEEAGLVAFDADAGEFRYRPSERIENWLRFIEAEHGFGE